MQMQINKCAMDKVQMLHRMEERIALERDKMRRAMVSVWPYLLLNAAPCELLSEGRSFDYLQYPNPFPLPTQLMYGNCGFEIGVMCRTCCHMFDDDVTVLSTNSGN